MLRSSRRAGRHLPILLTVLLPLSASLGQTSEIEPNDTCPGAQILGTPSLPFTVDGELSLPFPAPDIDFFALSGLPDEPLQIEHRGLDSDGGTLENPFLAVLDASCNVLAVNDDDGSSRDARIFVTVPPDGNLVLAATSCCDWGLTGDGYSRGSYTILVDRPHVVGSISAHLVDAETDASLPGWWPSNAHGELWRCHEGVCDQYVGSQWSDADGLVYFNSDYSGWPLLPGDYELRAFAEAYEPLSTGVFTAAEDDELYLGEIGLTPYDLIGAISGRVVDAIDDTGLGGTSPPWASVMLVRCREWGCWDYVGWTYADENGFFRFDYSNTWAPLLTGDYQLRAGAEQYREQEISITAVAADELRDIGRIRLEPYPVQFVDFTPCLDIPATGGSCQYSVVVRAGTPTKLDGEAWSIVNVWSTGSFLNSTVFQASGKRSGVPLPEKFKLTPGRTTNLRFQFEVPETVQAGAWICISAYVGQRPTARYSTLGYRDLFCVMKQADSFELVSEKEMRKQLHRNR